MNKDSFPDIPIQTPLGGLINYIPVSVCSQLVGYGGYHPSLHGLDIVLRPAAALKGSLAHDGFRLAQETSTMAFSPIIS